MRMTTPDPCAPDTTDVPDQQQILATVALLSAVAHPTRLTVLLALSRRGPMSAGALQAHTDVEQTALSHQLRVLREAGLVQADRAGRKKIYRLADHHVSHIVEDAISHARELEATGGALPDKHHARNEDRA